MDMDSKTKESSVKYLANESKSVDDYTDNSEDRTDNSSFDKTFTLTLRLSTYKDREDLYRWKLITDQRIIKSTHQTVLSEHPFACINSDDIESYKDTEMIYVGGINAKNKVMDSLFEIIMMSDEELEKQSGSLNHRGYRARLIKILHDLWD